jgi:hypothetical protein
VSGTETASFSHGEKTEPSQEGKGDCPSGRELNRIRGFLASLTEGKDERADAKEGDSADATEGKGSFIGWSVRGNDEGEG